jgi:hypothetical protein
MLDKPGKDDVTRLFGQVSDHTIVEVLNTEPSFKDLEVVSLFLAQENDVLGELREPLTGIAARIYDILMQDPAFLDGRENDRERS